MNNTKLQFITCKTCGETKSYLEFPYYKSGKRKGWRKGNICQKCHNSQAFSKLKLKAKEYHQHKTTTCNKCGFEGSLCQFDIHHKDGNHKNNTLSNLITLCANCHRLEHHL